MSLHEIFIVTPFSYEFMQRGLLSAAVLSLSGGLLGCILVLRRLALMGDALSHSLLPGIALAWLLFGPSTTALFVGALVAGLLTALGSALLSRLTRVKEDAAFGSLFIVFFGAGIAMVSKLPTQLNLSHVLFGDILGVGWAEIQIAAAVSIATVAMFVVFYRNILLETFDPLFHRATGGHGGLVHFGFLALTVLNLVAALQTMGQSCFAALVSSPRGERLSLVRSLFPPMLLGLSVALAPVCSVAGILLSYHAGLASGAPSCCFLGAVFWRRCWATRGTESRPGSWNFPRAAQRCAAFSLTLRP